MGVHFLFVQLVFFPELESFFFVLQNFPMAGQKNLFFLTQVFPSTRKLFQTSKNVSGNMKLKKNSGQTSLKKETWRNFLDGRKPRGPSEEWFFIWEARDVWPRSLDKFGWTGKLFFEKKNKNSTTRAKKSYILRKFRPIYQSNLHILFSPVFLLSFFFCLTWFCSFPPLINVQKMWSFFLTFFCFLFFLFRLVTSFENFMASLLFLFW